MLRITYLLLFTIWILYYAILKIFPRERADSMTNVSEDMMAVARCNRTARQCHCPCRAIIFYMKSGIPVNEIPPQILFLTRCQAVIYSLLPYLKLDSSFLIVFSLFYCFFKRVIYGTYYSKPYDFNYQSYYNF